MTCEKLFLTFFNFRRSVKALCWKIIKKSTFDNIFGSFQVIVTVLDNYNKNIKIHQKSDVGCHGYQISVSMATKYKMHWRSLSNVCTWASDMSFERGYRQLFKKCWGLDLCVILWQLQLI